MRDPAQLSDQYVPSKQPQGRLLLPHPKDYSISRVTFLTPDTEDTDIWIFDLVSGGKTRLTFDPADDLDCIWSPDETRIAFTSDRAGQRNLYWKLADGSGPEELLLGGKEGGQNLQTGHGTESILFTSMI
jgi:Tol biopolymer transport system component